jgi:hypothetical protein
MARMTVDELPPDPVQRSDRLLRTSAILRQHSRDLLADAKQFRQHARELCNHVRNFTRRSPPTTPV